MWIFQTNMGRIIGAGKDKAAQKALEPKQKAEENLAKNFERLKQTLTEMTAPGKDKNVHPDYVGIYKVFASAVRDKVLPSLKNVKPTKDIVSHMSGIVQYIGDIDGFPRPGSDLRWAIDDKPQSFREFLDDKIMHALYHVGELMPAEAKKPERAKFK